MQDGSRYNQLIAPLGLTSFRSALFALSPSVLPSWLPASAVGSGAGGAKAYSCQFRALINSWRDGMQNGDYAFSFVQNTVKNTIANSLSNINNDKTTSASIGIGAVSPTAAPASAFAGAAQALAEFSALPLPSGLLFNSSNSSSNPFRDKLDVDTTGMATVADLDLDLGQITAAGNPPNVKANGGKDDGIRNGWGVEWSGGKE
jgi:hypothetical protein